MKKGLFWACLLIMPVFFASGGYALPVINNISVQSPSLWLGETNRVYLNCTDSNSTTPISNASADITASTAIFPNNPFTLDAGGNYYLAISTAQPSNFNKAGIFNVTAYCTNSAGETANSSVSFAVSNLSLELRGITSPAYIGDTAEIDALLKKDGNPLTPPSNVYFNITLDGTNTPTVSQPYWDSIKGWVLNFDTTPQATGSHTLSITARYDRAQASAGANINILQPIVFSVASIDKSWVLANDEVTVVLNAIQRGNPVQMKKDYLSVQIDSAGVNITDLSPSASAGGGYSLKFAAPAMPAGNHILRIFFNYLNYSASYSSGISYVIPVSGNLFAGGEAPGQMQLRFTSDKTDKTIKTDNTGAYSTLLPPGTYTVQIGDGTPGAEIYGATISSGFDNGIKYQPFSSGTAEGIQGTGIYFFGIAFGYSGAQLKIPYDQSKISDESALRAYSCQNWNSGKKACMSQWNQIASSTDTLRKIASVNVTSLNAAYIIGSPDTATAEASGEKDTYNAGEKITVTGIAENSAKNIIADASIVASIKGTAIFATAKSNPQGVFSIELQNPGKEGGYNILLDVSKPPYLPSKNQINFTVVKSSDLSIIGPDTFRLAQGESSDSEFRIINTGEADLSGLKISINGLPSNYYRILPADSIGLIKSKEEKAASVHFEIPADAAKATFGAAFEVSGDGFSRRQSFALTVVSKANASTVIITQTGASLENGTQAGSPKNALSFGIPTMLSVLNAADLTQSGAGYIAAFAIISISTALMLRKKRISRQRSFAEKNNDRRILFEIRKKIAEPEIAKRRRLLTKRAAGYAKKW